MSHNKILCTRDFLIYKIRKNFVYCTSKTDEDNPINKKGYCGHKSPQDKEEHPVFTKAGKCMVPNWSEIKDNQSQRLSKKAIINSKV